MAEAAAIQIALDAADHEARVDLRLLKDQGIDREQESPWPWETLQATTNGKEKIAEVFAPRH